MFLKIKSCLLHRFEIISALETKSSDEDVIAVTKLCGIYEDIMQMPDRFDTWLGSVVSLSVDKSNAWPCVVLDS